MKYKPKIIWEKWRDPFGYDLDEDIIDPPVPLRSNSNEDDEDDRDDDLLKNAKDVRCKIVMTPFGMIPYTENTASGKIFNFWTGHSNFSITQNISNMIEDTDGVETLDVFTRYRFRISIGKAFEDSSVMREINKKVYSYLD